MESLASLYKNHIATLQNGLAMRWRASSWMRYLFTPANCSTFFSTIIPIRLK